MKSAIILVVMGIIGLGQYVYFQLTPLAYNQELYKTGDGIIHVITTRDWTAGLIGALVGAVVLSIGIYRLKRYRSKKANQLGT